MSALTNAGLAGAVAGLGVGVVEYVIVLRVIADALSREAGREAVSREAEDRVRAKLAPIKLVLLVAAFVVYPVVGYVVGNMITT